MTTSPGGSVLLNLVVQERVWGEKSGNSILRTCLYFVSSYPKVRIECELVISTGQGEPLEIKP